MKMIFPYLLTVCLWGCVCVLSYDLTLLHVNDIHVRMEETNKYSNACKEKDRKAGECYGGIARLHQKVLDIRKEPSINSLWVNAGDFYQGTPWYSMFKWRVVSQFNKMLNFDAITLGNHEFDDNIAGITPFLEEQSCPVVVTNLNTSLVPQMDGLYEKSSVIDKGGRKIGIVGYLTPKTTDIALPGDIIFIDEVEALKKEVESLHNSGVDIIIALGHSGYNRDMQIARAVPHLDVIVGGHSHTFLYTQTDGHSAPSNNEVGGNYPTLIDSPDGGKVLVVQAYAYTKYLGRVDLVFSEDGRIVSWTGEPILLDYSIPQDPEIERELVPWRKKLFDSTSKIIGSADVVLHHGRNSETILGNLLTDIFVWAYSNRTIRGERVQLAMMNSGSIRADIDAGNITQGDLLTVLPFQNTLDMVTLYGSTLLKVFEHSVSTMSISGKYAGGKFLQVSGFNIVYNLRKPTGSRVASCKVKGADGNYHDLEAEKKYHVISSDYTIRGGDGYSMIEDEMLDHRQGLLDTDVVKQYLDMYSPVSSQIEGRIELLTAVTAHSSRSGGSPAEARSFSIILLISCLFFICVKVL